jgi:predicted lactoylglutathione lyase
MKFNSILLYISNIETSSDFYQKLGFKIDTKDDKSVTVSLENLQLQLFDKEKVEFKQYSEVDPNNFSVFFYIEVDDVDEKYKELI